MNFENYFTCKKKSPGTNSFVHLTSSLASLVQATSTFQILAVQTQNSPLQKKEKKATKTDNVNVLSYFYQVGFNCSKSALKVMAEKLLVHSFCKIINVQ